MASVIAVSASATSPDPFGPAIVPGWLAYWTSPPKLDAAAAAAGESGSNQRSEQLPKTKTKTKTNKTQDAKKNAANEVLESLFSWTPSSTLQDEEDDEEEEDDGGDGDGDDDDLDRDEEMRRQYESSWERRQLNVVRMQYARRKLENKKLRNENGNHVHFLAQKESERREAVLAEQIAQRKCNAQVQINLAQSLAQHISSSTWLPPRQRLRRNENCRGGAGAGGARGRRSCVPVGLDVATYNALVQLQYKPDLTPEDYELLLRLDDTVQPRALTHDDVRKLEAKTLAEADLADLVSRIPQCLICMEAFAVGTKTRSLGVCEHVFHAECIEVWLTSSSTKCPLCKQEIQPST